MSVSDSFALHSLVYEWVIGIQHDLLPNDLNATDTNENTNQSKPLLGDSYAVYGQVYFVSLSSLQNSALIVNWFVQ